jgi:hypothetical protein
MFRRFLFIIDYSSTVQKWQLIGQQQKQPSGIEQVSTGSNSFCVPLSGQYQLAVIESCYRYDETDKSMIITVPPSGGTEETSLIPVSALVTGKVVASEKNAQPFQLTIKSV